MDPPCKPPAIPILGTGKNDVNSPETRRTSIVRRDSAFCGGAEDTQHSNFNCPVTSADSEPSLHLDSRERGDHGPGPLHPDQFVVSQIESPDVLLMATGSQAVVEQQLDMAKTLTGTRVRVAALTRYRSLVLRRGFEFYDVGGRSDEHLTRPHYKVSTAEEKQTLRGTSTRLWWASFDDAHLQTRGMRPRPFVADVAACDKLTATCAPDVYKIQASLILVSSQSGEKRPRTDESKDILRVVRRADQGDRCALFTTLKALWTHITSGLKLSGAAAAGLVSSQDFQWSEFELIAHARLGTLHGGELNGFPVIKQGVAQVQIYNVLCIVFTLSLVLLKTLGWKDKFSKENEHCLRMRDPVRQSRIKQAWYDLKLVKDHATEDLDRYILRWWEANFGQLRI